MLDHSGCAEPGRWYLTPSAVMPMRSASLRRVISGSVLRRARIRSRVVRVSWVVPRVSRVHSWVVPRVSWVVPLEFLSTSARSVNKERVEEPPHQRIAPQVVAQRDALLGELTLDAADEDAERLHGFLRTLNYRRSHARRSRWNGGGNTVRENRLRGRSAHPGNQLGRAGRETNGGTGVAPMPPSLKQPSRLAYATTPRTISPWTSVSRKFRPWYG